jgi:DNA polymerase-3 subunit delta
MDTNQLAREIKKTIAPVYLLAGEESILIDRALDLVTKHILENESSADFALSKLDGKSATAAEVENASRTVSLFGGRRLIILRNAQSLAKNQQEQLVKYLAKPVASSTLVMIVRGAGEKTRDPKLSKVVTTIKKYKKACEKGGGVFVDCPRIRVRDLPKVVQQEVKNAGLTIGQEATFALVEAIGDDLTGLTQAVEKLVLYLAGQGEVSEQVVNDIVANTRRDTIFALTDAVAEGSLGKALGVLNIMIRDGMSPLAIVAHLVRHFRNLARCLALRARGLDQETIRKDLGLHPFVVKKSLQQARQFSQKALADRLVMLADADRELKYKKLKSSLRLEKLIMDLCRR